MDHLAIVLIDSQLDLELENKSMSAFINRAHKVVLAALAEREEMAEILSQIESYSHSLKDQVTSFHEEVGGLLLYLERSQKDVSRCHHEAKAQVEE